MFYIHIYFNIYNLYFPSDIQYITLMFFQLTEAFSRGKNSIHRERNPKLPGLFGPFTDHVFLRDPLVGLHKFIIKEFFYANKQTCMVISLTYFYSIKILPAVRK